MQVEIGNTYEFSMPFGKNLVAKVLEVKGFKSVRVFHVKGKPPFKGCKEYSMMYSEVVRQVI